MAKAPCARLTNPISPMVSDSPTDTMYSTIAKARPWNRMLISASMTRWRARSFHVVDDFPRVLNHGERFELDIAVDAIDVPDLAQIFVLHDIARLRVDHDRAARAGVFPTFQQRHGLVRIDRAILRRDDVEDRRHAVERGHRHIARLLPGAVLRLISRDERLVFRPYAGGAVTVHGQRAKRGVAHFPQLLVRNDAARTDQFNAGLAESKAGGDL